MKLLELFKGTGSVGKVFKNIYPEGEVYSVDILEKYEPTWCGDIMAFDYKQFPIGHFDIIWASPECKIFSILQNTWIKTDEKKRFKWNSKEHLQQVREEHGKFCKRTLEIIEYLKPTWWFIENPWTSAMKDLEHMKNLPSIRFDYCRFGYLYQKPTRIWTNRELDTMKCECTKRHQYRLGIGKKSKFLSNTPSGDQTDINQRYSIPPKLIEYLFKN